jgi:hypothetical protein
VTAMQTAPFDGIIQWIIGRKTYPTYTAESY